MTLGIGEYSAIDLEDVESLRVNGDVRVILFNRPNFEGRSVMLTGDSADLEYMQKRSWGFGLLPEHRTGSMIIEPLG